MFHLSICQTKNLDLDDDPSIESLSKVSEFQFNWNDIPTTKFEDIAGLEDVKEIVTSLCEVKIADETINILHKKSNRFRQLVKNIMTFENLAQTNGYKTITNKELGW